MSTGGELEVGREEAVGENGTQSLCFYGGLYGRERFHNFH